MYRKIKKWSFTSVIQYLFKDINYCEQGVLLKRRINTKLSVCQAAAVVQTKGLLLSDLDGKATKSLLRGTLALLLDAADACVVSSWRKVRACEELFGSLLSGTTRFSLWAP